MATIVKNISSTAFADANLNDLGLEIAVSSQLTIEPTEYELLAASASGGDTEAEITAGRIVLNNGIADFTDASLALNFLRNLGTSIIVRENGVDRLVAARVLDFQNSTVTDDGNGIVEIESQGGAGGGLDDAMIAVRCEAANPQCVLEAALLIDQTLCLITDGVC